jgi:hypothetical protein
MSGVLRPLWGPPNGFPSLTAWVSGRAMGGMLRCGGCGTIRWSPLSLDESADGRRCGVCGGQLRRERRRPGRRLQTPSRERRDARPTVSA